MSCDCYDYGHIYDIPMSQIMVARIAYPLTPDPLDWIDGEVLMLIHCEDGLVVVVKLPEEE